MNLTEEARLCGEQIDKASATDRGAVLNSSIERFAGWPYKAIAGYIVDSNGQASASFASIVHTAFAQPPGASPDAIPADNAAAVIDVIEDLDLDSLRTAYKRIVQVKRLKKSPAPNLKVPVATLTLGMIFAKRTAVAFETIAEELQRLNAGKLGGEWLDMIAVSSVGIISYGCQFPGEAIIGDWLPPAEGAIESYIPAIYMLLTMKPAGAYTFNRLAAYLLAYLYFFSPGASIPNFNHLLEGVPKSAVVVIGYQYNLKGEIVPVPRQFYNDRYIPPLPMRIEAQTGELLATLQFLPWQDGGVLLLRGKLPLTGLIVFLGKEPLKKAGVMKRPPDVEISYVLPITNADYTVLLQRIGRQSNMVVRKTEPKLTIQKFANEGSSSPFFARVILGVTHLRDVIYPDATKRDDFDKPYDQVFTSLMTARTAAQEVSATWTAHNHKVLSGQIARLQGGSIHVDESIDRDLRKQVESFLYAASRTMKTSMHQFAVSLNRNIGFLFMQDGALNNGIAALQTTDPVLADYLEQTRTWSEALIKRRNSMDHTGWSLPRVTYAVKSGAVVMDEPTIDGMPATQFVAFMLDRVCCFVEEFTAHCLQTQMPRGITFTEIPMAERDPSVPERFRLTLHAGGLQPWTLAYHKARFEEV